MCQAESKNIELSNKANFANVVPDLQQGQDFQKNQMLRMYSLICVDPI